MQPTIEPAAEAKSNGPTLEATADAHLNGNGAIPELQDLLAAMQAMSVGDFSVRMSGNRTGIAGKIADTFNEIVAANARMAQQLEHVGQVVGREGRTRQRVRFGIAR